MNWISDLKSYNEQCKWEVFNSLQIQISIAYSHCCILTLLLLTNIMVPSKKTLTTTISLGPQSHRKAMSQESISQYFSKKSHKWYHNEVDLYEHSTILHEYHAMSNNLAKSCKNHGMLHDRCIQFLSIMQAFIFEHPEMSY